MGVQDAVRLAAIREAAAGRISIREAMRRTGLSRSQVLRYKRRYRRQGPSGLLHGNRGRPSARRTAEATRARIVALLEGPVVLNDCHLRDLLAEDQVTVSADTVRRVRQALGRPPKQRRRPRRYRQRREREAQVGAMVLIDGSPFRWLGEAQPMATLIGAIDDATGQILSLVLRPTDHGRIIATRDAPGSPFTLTPRHSPRPRYRSAEPPPLRLRKPAPPRPARGTQAYLASVKPTPSHVWRRGYKDRAARRKEAPVGVS